MCLLGYSVIPKYDHCAKEYTVNKIQKIHTKEGNVLFDVPLDYVLNVNDTYSVYMGSMRYGLRLGNKI